MKGHPHHETIEQTVLHVTPYTAAAGGAMVVWLPLSTAMLPSATIEWTVEMATGITVVLASIAAFALVHCIRFNRRRRARHKKQEIC